MKVNPQSASIALFVLGAVGFVSYELFQSPPGRTYSPGTQFAERARLNEVTTNGVHVGFFLEADPRGQTVLRATFTPIEPGFHLYGKDLAADASGGIGLATRLELPPHASARSDGPLFADIAPEFVEIKELNATLPIYRDGPVTLRLPIQMAGDRDAVPATALVSYMACKTDGICLQQVKRLAVDLWISKL